MGKNAHVAHQPRSGVGCPNSAPVRLFKLSCYSVHEPLGEYRVPVKETVGKEGDSPFLYLENLPGVLYIHTNGTDLGD